MLALRIAVAIMMIWTQQQAAKENRVVRAKVNISEIETALLTFEVDSERYPTTEEGLQALVQRPPNLKNWRQTMPRVPVDPWGYPYVYRCPGQHNVNGFDLSSYGPDGKEGGGDDITNWLKP